MQYRFINNNKPLEDIYKKGEYYIENEGKSYEKLYRIIYDNDLGYALLNVSTGHIESEFQYTIEELISNTVLSDMTHVVQVNEIEFKLHSQQVVKF